MRRTFVTLLTIAAIALAAGAVVHAAKFKSTWKAPDVGRLNFAGKKVAVAFISSDQNLQVSAEEALARELAALGVKTVPAYRLVPREEIGKKESVKGFFERAGVEGLVAMRVVSADKEVTYTPDVWVSTMYASPWDYYAYGWGTAIGGVTRREDLVVTIETLVFNVTQAKLVWAGVSEKTNPKGSQKLAKELVSEIVNQMRKEGLVPKGRP
jgi:hypothetical protein